jgi:glycosyltransferase involved in cell wall biosynthesis
MNVCVLGLRGLPRVMGGVETHCENLYPLLKSLRPQDPITVIARKAYVTNRACDYQGLRIVPLVHASGKHFEAITSTAYGVVYAKFALHAELLHLHGIGPALMAPLARTLGMKIIVTYHSKNYEHRKWNWVGKLALRAGELCAVSLADRVITVSEGLAADLKRRFPEAAHKIHFIPNGADHLLRTPLTTRSINGVLSRYGLSKGGYIVSVGRLVPEKGIHHLIDAFKSADLRCKLVIVGDADHRDDYSRRLLAQAGDTIVFTGFLSADALRPVVQNASLFVLPSYNEGLPISALEAAAVGTPVLLSDIQPNRELGFRPESYFRVGDVDDLRRRLAQDHEIYRVDRDAILRRYSWNAASAETDKIYSSLQVVSSAKRWSAVRAWVKRLSAATWRRA